MTADAITAIRTALLLPQVRNAEASLDFDRLSTKYVGTVAKSYEARRRDRKWAAEQRAAEALIDAAAPGLVALDAPAGTGRAIPLLTKRGFHYCGLDVSADMLGEARARAKASGVEVELRRGDIRDVPFDDQSFDLVVCLRFLNWLDPEGVAEIVAELSRVARGRLLIGVRYFTPFRELKLAAALAVGTARVARIAAIHARSHGMVIHRKDQLEALFTSLDLHVREARTIERRWDGTDYLFYLLEKPGRARPSHGENLQDDRSDELASSHGGSRAWLASADRHDSRRQATI